jgi:hypothetical protein
MIASRPSRWLPDPGRVAPAPAGVKRLRYRMLYLRHLPWLIFVVSLLVWVPIFGSLAEQGQVPIDFLAYRRAADALERGESPYPEPAESQRIWRYFHQIDGEIRAAAVDGRGQETLREILARPQQPGPYIYPPTLALLVSQLRIGGTAFGILLLVSVLGFGWLWLRSTGAGPAWLALIFASWDVLASLSGGNVELLLLFATLLASRLLWDRLPLAAAPLIALVVLIKPFYVLAPVAFGALQLAGRPTAIRSTLRSLALAAGAALALVAVEIARWGGALRTEAMGYLLQALDHLWLVLPVAEQTPMSAWSRVPLQGLVNAGLAVSTAQEVAFGGWGVLLAITVLVVWRARSAELPFSLLFALSFVLLYLGRPVGWGLIYLEIVVLVAVWPDLTRWQRITLLAATLALMASRWWALALTIQGQGLQLLTLQSAAWPWETWLILPLCWLLLLRQASSTLSGRHRPSRPLT